MVSLLRAATARRKSVLAPYKAELVISTCLSRLALALPDFRERLCFRFLKQYNIDNTPAVDYSAFLKNLSVKNDANFKYLLSNAGKDFPSMLLRGFLFVCLFFPCSSSLRNYIPILKLYPLQRYP